MATIHTNDWGDRSPEPKVQRRLVFQTHLLRRLLVSAAVVALVASAMFLTGWVLGRSQPTAMARIMDGVEPTSVVMPADFENHQGLLLAWPAGMSEIEEQVLVDIAVAAHTNLTLLVVAPDPTGERHVTGLLKAAGVDLAQVRFVHMPIVGPWVRDYGPIVVKSTQGGYRVVEALYGPQMKRASDDQLAVNLATRFGIEVTRSPLIAEGGNLLSNGAGLCVTSDSVLQNNAEKFTQAEISKMLTDQYGASSVVYLERLEREESGHADMVAAFLAPDQVVVGQYDPRDNPINAAILDRNAALLKGKSTPCGPLRVHRIPMPPITFGNFIASYTNVVFANGKLLVPTYMDIDPAGSERALRLYRKLLPGYTVVGIHATPLVQRGGAVHCATMNLYSLGDLP